jgi:hypothetical protein
MSQTAASWCLTDGEKWIFGVTWKHEGGCRYDTATIDELTDEGRVPKDLESRSELILKTIACWVSTGVGTVLRFTRTERSVTQATVEPDQLKTAITERRKVNSSDSEE